RGGAACPLRKEARREARAETRTSAPPRGGWTTTLRYVDAHAPPGSPWRGWSGGNTGQRRAVRPRAKESPAGAVARYEASRPLFGLPSPYARASADASQRAAGREAAEGRCWSSG